MADTNPGLPHVDLGGYVLGALGASERAAFEQHLAGCERCRRELEELRGMPALLGRAAEPVAVPAGMESRVLGVLAREPRPRPARRRWATGWALAAAAALALAFVAGLGLGRALPPGGGGVVTPAPGVRTVRLVATDGGPASAVATIRPESGGKVIELSVRDLPPPPAGQFYTCWLVA